jgi:UDP-N-acetyl-D-glucosamine dehydrogenase
VRDALRNMGKPLAASEVLLLGAAYREDVGDTRYSGSEIMVRKLTEMGANVRVHDPYLDHWWEFEAQDTSPHPGYSASRFFHRQEALKDLRIEKDLWAAMKGVDAIVLAVRHEPYLKLDPTKWSRASAGPLRRGLFLHPRRREDPPLPGAGLRGQGHGPRPHQTDQGHL